ncbi:Cif family virulence factor [Edaphobacter bradus]|uniref:hypothetical protein n=1 Tax=Edaphobacter bradus TaxID=2259016 RepID=UPI0021E01259|nr:hypothetical protein [Edaphobacter bradus]
MRFETTETVPTGDAEQVLHALELSLLELSDEVERQGRQLTLRGLGPSPRARNYRDTAIFEVVPSHDSTAIHANISFQASALLGSSPQDAPIRAKLDYAFGQMRARLGLPGLGRSTTPLEPVPEPVSTVEPESPAMGEPEPAADPTMEAVGPLPVEPPVASPAELPVERPVVPLESPGEASVMPPTVQPIEPPTASSEPTPTSGPIQEASERPKPTAETASKPSQPTAFAALAAQLAAASATRTASGSRKRAVVAEPPRELPTIRLAAADSSHSRTRMPLLVALLLALTVSAGTIYLYWAGRLDLQSLRLRPATPPAEAQPQPAPVAVVPPTPPAPPPHTEADPKVWLEEWADSMRGRDPVLEASFYADPVGHYLGDANVGNQALIDKFRSAIQDRSGVWTVKLERVAVQPRTDSDLTVRLTKHFMQLADATTPDSETESMAGSQIADRYVRTQLELKRINGEWKIVSEQETAAPGKPQV